MAQERFPRAKYVRQLHALDRELAQWQVGYAHAAEGHPDDWLGSRFEERFSVLEEARARIYQLAALIEGMPRLA